MRSSTFRRLAAGARVRRRGAGCDGLRRRQRCGRRGRSDTPDDSALVASTIGAVSRGGENPSSASATDLVGDCARWVGRRPTGCAVAACSGRLVRYRLRRRRGDGAATAARSTFRPLAVVDPAGAIATTRGCSPTDIDHLHVNYVDATIDVCLNPDNPYDTPLGMYRRVRTASRSIRLPNLALSTLATMPTCTVGLYLTDAWVGLTPRPFTLERMRILSARPGCATGCSGGPWVAAEPVGRSTSLAWCTAGRVCRRDCGTCPGGPRERSAWTSPGPAAPSRLRRLSTQLIGRDLEFVRSHSSSPARSDWRPVRPSRAIGSISSSVSAGFHAWGWRNSSSGTRPARLR